MSAQDPPVDVGQIEQARRQINRLAEEIAQLSEAELSPPEYYGEYLQRLLTALAAPAGAVWLRTPQGNLQLQYQINMRQVGLDRAENSRQMHDELLRQAAMKAQPGLFPPHSGAGTNEAGAAPAGNPTDYVVLLAPILYDKQVAGIVEIWQDPNRNADAQRGFLQFMVRMAALAAGYTRNHQLRQMVGQQQVWVQLESFARQIHSTLNPTEVAYLVANEGRRLAEVDRVSVAVRQGSKAQVLAISGADVVEKRSNLVQLMRTLFDKVLAWGEKLVYMGTKDEALPPDVLKALDAFLAESNCKFLVVCPLKDERDEGRKVARSAILLESFESAENAEQAMARLEVIGRHAGPALYNAAEYRRIPFRFVWLPLAKIQDGLGGKAKAIVTLIFLGLGVLIAAMVFVPYPLKMEAKGQLLPSQRSYAYAEREGHIKEIKTSLRSGTPVRKGQELIRMFDAKLAVEINALDQEIQAAQSIIDNFSRPGRDAGSRQDYAFKVEEARLKQAGKLRDKMDLVRNYNAVLARPGEFWVRSPRDGLILSADFRENLLGRYVTPDQGLIYIGSVDPEQPRLTDWEVELRIPQKNIGQVLEASRLYGQGAELDVDLLLLSAPTRTFKGKLVHISKQADHLKDANDQPEPVVTAKVRLYPKKTPDGGLDIPPEAVVPPELLLTGTEVNARIRCGDRAMGYSLFYGVWEFFYENIAFRF